MLKRRALRALPGWLIPAGILLAALLLILLVVFGVRAFSQRNNMQLGSTISISNNAQPMAYGSDYIYSANMTLYCVGASGETRWTLPLEQNNAPYDVMGKDLCIAVNDVLYVYRQQDDGTVSEVFHKNLQGLLMDAVICGQSHMALVTQARDAIYVLGSDGSQIDTIDLNGQTIIDVGFYSKQDLMWVVSLDTRGSAPQTNVRIYDLGRATIAMQSFSDELISTMVVDTKSGTALTMGTQYISAIDVRSGTGVSTGQATSIYGYQYVCDNGAASCKIVLAPAAQLLRQSVIDLSVFQSGKLSTITLPTQCQAFLATDRFLYAANASTVYRLDYTGKVLEQIDMTDLYDRVEAVGKNNLFFFKGNSATIITVK